MTSKDNRPEEAAELRKKAEATARQNAAQSPENLEALSPEEMQRTLHELRVHQIELEMQNEELRRAQEELDATRARYFDLYDLAPVGYCTLSEKGLILEANLTAATLLGVTRGALVKQLLTRFILEEDQDIYYLHRKQLFQTGEPQACEVRMVKQDSAAFWAHLETTVAQDEGGSPVFRFIISDITERRQVEEAVAQTKHNYETFFETIDDFLYVLDEQGRMLHTNDTVSRRLGYTREELLGQPVLMVHPPERRDEAGRIVQEMLAGTMDFCPVPVMTKGGRLIPVETRVTRGEWDRKPALFGVSKDISQLKLSEDKFSKAFHSNTSLMALSTEQGGVFIDVNETFLATVGFTRDEVIGKSPVDLRLFAVPENRAHALAKLDETGQVCNLEVQVRTKDGAIRVGLFSVDHVMIGEVPCLLTTMADITERKRAEEALQESGEKYRLLAEHMSDIVWLMDMDTKTTYQSPSSEKLRGFTDQEIKDLPLEKNLTPESLQLALGVFFKEIPRMEADPSYNPVTNMELEYYRKDGSAFWLENRFSIIRDGSGKPVSILGEGRDITERKQVQEALQTSEANLSNALQMAHAGHWEYDVDRDIFTFNDNFYRIFRTTAAAVGGCQMSSADYARRFCYPDDIAIVANETRAAIESTDPNYSRRIEHRILYADGQVGYITVRFFIVKDPQGRTIKTYGVNQDITERKHAEDALRESEAQNLALISAFPDILFMNRRDGEFLAVHTSHPELLFAPPETFLHRKVGEIMPKPLADQFMKAFADALDLEAVQEINYALPVGGEERRLEARVTPCAKDTVITIVRDVTERKQAEDALRTSETQYRLLIETMQDGVYRSSHEGKFLEVNPAMVKMLGYESKEELLAIDIKSQLYFAPEDRESAALDEGLDQMQVERLRKNDGSEIWVEDHGRYVFDDEGAVLCHEGVLRDITERKQLEEKIRQVRSDLLFAVSHDLKSPIQTLRQTQEMLGQLSTAEALARFQEYGEIWRRNLQRLERMINNLVDSQRGEEGRFPLLLAPSDPMELVKRAVEDLQGYALSSQVSFDLNLQHAPQGSCGDEEALGRVVENLLTNSIKFSPKGGKVEVRLAMEGDTLLLEVEDHGLGIPANEQAQLFQPFQRSRSAQQKRIPGTGLGLYVCRRIVEEHGGSITLTSEEGKGAKVTVRLPWKVE
ncbi:MAG: PAS domain S-box protein [Coprothermobacterota bacterium]|nr:PAS domain S-box protein [Coprothermobacterota bacterium]